MGDTLELFGKEFTNVTGFKAKNDNDQIQTYFKPSFRELTVTPSDVQQVFYPSYETLKGTITSSGTAYGSYDKTITHNLQLTSGALYRIDGYFTSNTYDPGATIEVSGTYACGAVIYSSSTWMLTLNASNLIAHNYGSRTDNFYLSIDIYSQDEHYDGFSKVTVNVASGASIGTKTVTGSSATSTSLSFSGLDGEPKAFFVRCTESLTRSSSMSYYYITAIRYDGANTYGNYWRMSSGAYYNDTTHYSFTYSNGTLTVTSSASRGSAGGSFINGDYELTYIY